MGLGDLVIGLRACYSAVHLVIGDFSCFRLNVDSWGFLFNHSYGVRVEGFSCDWLGLRVFWSSGSGLRVRSPDDHVTSLIPLYLTWVFSLFPSPHPLFPSHHWLHNHPPTSSSQMTTPFAQYVDGMMGKGPVFNPPMQLVGFYLYDLFGKSFW